MIERSKSVAFKAIDLTRARHKEVLSDLHTSKFQILAGTHQCGFISEEEGLIRELVRQGLQVVLAQFFDFLGLVHSKSHGLDSLGLLHRDGQEKTQSDLAAAAAETRALMK